LKNSYYLGTYETSYNDLVKIFGEPNSEGDFEKISTEWNLEDDKGNLLNISDYKVTDIYDPDYPSVDDFRSEPSYNWRIYSDNREILKDFLTFVYLKTKSLNESIDFFPAISDDEIKDKIKDMNWWKKMKIAAEHDLLWLAKELVEDKNYGADWDDIRNFLKKSCERGSVNVVRYLLTLSDKIVDFDPSYNDNMCLKITNNKQIFKMLKEIPRVFNKLTPEDDWYYTRRYYLMTESTDFFPGISDEEVEERLKNLPNDEKLCQILENGLRHMYTDEEIKEMNDKLKIKDRLYNIFEFDLSDIYSDNDIKEIVNNYSENMDNKLGLIFNDYREFLLYGIYGKDGIKNMILKCKGEDKLDYMDSYGFGDYYSGDEIKRIVNSIQDSYTKINCVFIYKVNEYFTVKEIMTMFNRLNDIEKNNILDHDELLNILPKDIIEKYE